MQFGSRRFGLLVLWTLENVAIYLVLETNVRRRGDVGSGNRDAECLHHSVGVRVASAYPPNCFTQAFSLSAIRSSGAPAG